MGMFDSIKCEYPLPLTEELSKIDVNWSEHVFQTKDLDCALSLYIINKEGLLDNEIIERDYVLYTEEEIKTLKPKPWSVYKEVIEKNRYNKRTFYHGIVNFYDSIEFSKEEEMWVEFAAYFVYGKIDKIELIEATKKEAHSISIEKWQKEMEERQKLPWNRIKRFLRYFGWHWFWRKVTRVCYLTQQLLGKIQNTINRTIL